MDGLASRTSLVVGISAGVALWAGLCFLMPLTTDSLRVLFVVFPLLLATGLGLVMAAGDLKALARMHPPPAQPSSGSSSELAAAQSKDVARMGREGTDLELDGRTADHQSDSVDGRPPLQDTARQRAAQGSAQRGQDGSAVHVNRPTQPIPPNERRSAPVMLGPGVNIAFSKWMLRYTVDGVVGSVDLPVQTDDVYIGRGADNHIVIHHPKVSTTHLRILCEGGLFHVLDVGSRNGSALLRDGSGRTMDSGRRFTWPAGGKVVIPGQPPAVVSLELVAKGKA